MSATQYRASCPFAEVQASFAMHKLNLMKQRARRIKPRNLHEEMLQVVTEQYHESAKQHVDWYVVAQKQLAHAADMARSMASVAEVLQADKP